MPANRDKNGRFIKGYSGNSPGRPRTPQAFKDLAKEKSMLALRAVVAIVENEGSDPRDVIAGARLIIEYAYGKPQQDVSVGLDQGGDFVIEIVGDGSAQDMP